MSHHTEILYSYEPKYFSQELDVHEGNALSPSDKESIRNGAYRLYEVDLHGTVYVVAKNPAEVEKQVLSTLERDQFATDRQVKSVFEVTNYDRLDPKYHSKRVFCTDLKFHNGKREPKLKAIIDARVSEKERKIAELKKQLAELEAQP